MKNEYVTNSSGLMQRKYTDEDIETELTNERTAVIQQKQQLENEIAQLQEESRSKIAAEELSLKQETIDAEKSIKDKEAENDLKREQALLAAKENEQKNMTVAQRMRRKQEEAQELQDKLDQLDAIRKAEGDLTAEQKEQYDKLTEDKKKKDAEYMEMKKTYFKYQTPQERLDAYKQAVKDIKEEAKEKRRQNDIDNADNPEEHAKRKKEIDKEEKEKTKEAQGAFGIGLGQNGKSIISGISNAIKGGDGGGGLVDTITSVLGTGSPLVSAVMAGIKVVTAIFGALNSINKLVDSGVQRAVDNQSAYLGQINARLYGLTDGLENYYAEMIKWGDTKGDFGLAIGRWNAVADRQTYIQKLNDLVQSGIAYNAEERALLSTVADRMVTTFDVMDATLTRLVRIQQLDMTAAAMGGEALLTHFLNSQPWISDTSYLSDMYDSVSATLIDAMARLNADEAASFNYEVQKWLGSLYSLGLSQQGVQSLAQGIGYLQTGDVNALTSNPQLQYIYAAAADRAGLSLGDILVQGLDTETTNLLLENVVTLLQDIYNNSKANTVQSAWTNITGLSISDLKAISNVSSSYLASISNEHQSYASSLAETDYQLEILNSDVRTGIAQAIDNIISNALLNVGDRIANETLATNYINDTQHYNITDDNWTLGGAINDALGIGGISKYIVYKLGDTVGGTIGGLMQSMVTVPAVLAEVAEFGKEQLQGFSSADVGSRTSVRSGISEVSRKFNPKLGADREAIRSLSLQGNLMNSYYDSYEHYLDNLGYINDLLYNVIPEQFNSDEAQAYLQNFITNRSLNNVSESSMMRNTQAFLQQQQLISDIESSYGTGLLAPNSANASDVINLTSAIDNQVSLTRTATEELTSNVENLSSDVSSYSQTLQTFESQANRVQATQVAIQNQSVEDQQAAQALENADELQGYLFQNEKTIRVTLVDTEEPAREDLYNAVSKELVDKLITVIGLMQTGVMVDVIDNDMNSILNKVYSVKQS